MAILAWVLGILGGLCAVVGVITAAEVITIDMPAAFTAMLWLSLSTVLLLACIAAAVSRSAYE